MKPQTGAYFGRGGAIAAAASGAAEWAGKRKLYIEKQFIFCV